MALLMTIAFLGMVLLLMIGGTYYIQNRLKGLLTQQMAQQQDYLHQINTTWTQEQASMREGFLAGQLRAEQGTSDKINQFNLQLQKDFSGLKEQLKTDFYQHRAEFDKHQLQAMGQLQENLQLNINQIRQQLNEILQQHNTVLNTQMEKLTQAVNERLKEISGQVEKRLSDGFEKTTETFADVIKRLALIDQAQQKITELSNNVVSLQDVLADRKARGAFGEVQLSGLVSNLLPSANYQMQYTFKNGKRADCVLFLPEPTGTLAIDAKFPLENYRVMNDPLLSASDKKAAEQQFRQDIRHHLNDIASKYIIPGETSDGAVMFIPAESVFADIHAKFPEIIEESHRRHVWLVSPTTMMAILTTARAVIKDAATRQQVHVIQEHLGLLAKDFERFEKRMDALGKHIEQTHDDVKQVNISAKKITSRFSQIERVELSLMGGGDTISTSVTDALEIVELEQKE
jgi:DNA recombination protein RmuC